MSSHRKQRVDAESVKDIKGRLPLIAGWMVEFLTFRKLHGILTTNLGKNGVNVGLIRGSCTFLHPFIIGNAFEQFTDELYLGPDHATVDGGFIVNPPHDFPYEDLTSALRWAEKWSKHPKPEPLQIYRFDAKMGIVNPKPGQWAPFFIVTVPEFPKYLCIVPLRCWFNLNMVIHRRMRTGVPSLRTNQEIVFDDLLAPFAVHEDQVYNALTLIFHAHGVRQFTSTQLTESNSMAGVYPTLTQQRTTSSKFVQNHRIHQEMPSTGCWISWKTYPTCASPSIL